MSPSQAARTTRLGYLVKAFPRISETFILNEVLELESQGFDLRLYALNRPRDKRRHRYADQVRSRCEYLPEPMLRALALLWTAHVWLFVRHPWRYLKTFVEVLWAGDADLFERFVQVAGVARWADRDAVGHVHAAFAHAPATVAWLLHRITGLPYSVAAHAKDLYHAPPALLRRKLLAASAVFTCTRYNLSYLRRVTAPGHIRRLRQLYHGTSLGRFEYAAYGSVDPPLVLSVARLVEKKGLEYLLHACAALRRRGVRFRCSVIGDGARRTALERLRATLGLESIVQFEGALPQEEVCRRYRQASLKVLPCIIANDGDRDGIPNVLVEAAASGVPIISTPTSGVPELVRHGETGWLVPPRDPAALADAIERLLADPAERERLRRNARSLVEREFNLQRNAASLGDELQLLLKGTATAAESAALPQPALELAERVAI